VPTYQEVRLGRSSDKEITVGIIVGAACAAVAVWFLTALVFSLAHEQRSESWPEP
jgi:putative effector of murein hydrolase